MIYRNTKSTIIIFVSPQNVKTYLPKKKSAMTKDNKFQHKWIFDPKWDVKLKTEDMVIVTGFKENVEQFKDLVK